MSKKKRISRLFDIKKDAEGRRYLEVYHDGITLLRLVLSNKGTAFSQDERVALKLDGLLPPQVNTLEQQVARVHRSYENEPSPLAKYQFLRGLQERQEILFYALLERNIEEMLPIVYTPTVGDAVKHFSFLYQNPRGISISPLNVHRARSVLDCYPMDDVRMIVATDSSAILGIGDQGYGGLAIPIGKLALYTVGGGVSPFHTMPVSLDVGTERVDLIDDPAYLGVRQRRLRGDEYLGFMDQFVDAVSHRYPDAVLQWEDLGKDAAFTVLERYRDKHPSFNDDIQGTGAVALAGVIAACHLKNERLVDQRVVISGAGAGGVGVALAIRDGMIEGGLSLEEATKRIFVLDSRGILLSSRPMEDYKRVFAHDPALVRDWKCKGDTPDLAETIRYAGATVLLGLSGQPGTFGEAEIKATLLNSKRPVIFPLSNPTSSCEATPEDIFAWSDGRAIVATGSPFPPVKHGGKSFPIGQGNNAFIFPGLGFGAILCRARKISDGMVAAAARALADYTIERYTSQGLIYPPITDLREASVRVATYVVKKAVDEGLAQRDVPDDVDAFVRARAWKANYLPTVRGFLDP